MLLDGPYIEQIMSLENISVPDTIIKIVWIKYTHTQIKDPEISIPFE